MLASLMTERIGIDPTELRGIHLFRDLSDADLQRLTVLFEPVGAVEDELLFAQGEAADAFYLLIAGEVSLRQDEREVYLLKPPCLIGELGATTGILRHCRAVVGPATVLRRIDSARLHDFCSQNPDIGLTFYRALLGSAAEKIAHDQRRTAEMREHIIVTQKTMKGMREFILESPDTPISRRVHDALEGLIQQNRRANYRVEPPPALAAHFRLDDGRVANVVELSRTHVNFSLTGALPVPNSEIAGVLVLAGPEIPASGRVLRVQGGLPGPRADVRLPRLSRRVLNTTVVGASWWDRSGTRSRTRRRRHDGPAHTRRPSAPPSGSRPGSSS
jgi:CRP-like cAMP-binding protein